MIRWIKNVLFWICLPIVMAVGYGVAGVATIFLFVGVVGVITYSVFEPSLPLIALDISIIAGLVFILRNTKVRLALKQQWDEFRRNL